MSIEARDARGVPEEGFHEIQLSGKQLVFLFMATTVVSIVIFLCGVLVGRGVRANGPGEQGVAAGAPAADRGVAEGADLPSGQPQRAEPAPPAEEPMPAEPPSAEELSYPNRLGATRPPADELTPEKARVPKPPPRTPTPAASAASGPPPPAAAPAATVPGRGHEGRYVVQVAALRERSEAEVIARRLSGLGYPAYVDVSSGPGAKMHRVRVGGFKDRREADKIRQRLEKEEQFKPWVTTR